MSEERYVVINHEEQYSIWPVGKAIPRDWRATGKKGDKAQCIKYIEEVWTDINPRELNNVKSGRLPR